MNTTNKETNAKGGKAISGRRRSAARLAAVQALYELDMAGSPVGPVLGEFILKRWDRAFNDDTISLVEPDEKLLDDLVRGVSERRQDLDALIKPVLAEEWTIERLEILLRAILRSGAYELMVRFDIPPRVIISEYVDVAHAFFAGNESGLVNGVLDRLAHTLREGQLEKDKSGKQTQDR